MAGALHRETGEHGPFRALQQRRIGIVAWRMADLRCARPVSTFFLAPLSHISVGKSDHDSSHPPYLGLFLIATEVSPGPGSWFTEQNTNTINHTERKTKGKKKKTDGPPGFYCCSGLLSSLCLGPINLSAGTLCPCCVVLMRLAD